MKKRLFFLPLLAAMALVGCTKEESDDAGGSNGETDTHYLAVSISTTPSIGSRADGQYDQGGKYEDGTEAENKVNSLRFYFFSSAGAAVNVAAGSSVNYIDIKSDDIKQLNQPDHNLTVSDKLAAVLIVDTKKGDRLPALIATIINPPADLSGSINLTDFRALTRASFTDANGGFVMSDAVYVNDAKKIESITAVNPAQYHNTKDEAIANPLQIYVERAVAKVRVNLSAGLQPTAKGIEEAGKAIADNGNIAVNETKEDGTIVTHNLIKMKYKESGVEKDLTVTYTDADGKKTEKQVYAELMGWNTTAIRPVAYLIKHLKDEWRNSPVEGIGEAWNLPQLHRCFWADFCEPTGNQHFDFDGSHALTFDANRNYTYCNENAERQTGTLATKVIIPAVLCDETAKPLMICEYAGIRYVDNDELNNSKDYVLNAMKIGGNEFWTTEDEGKTYRTINRNDIEFTTNYSSADPAQTNRYLAEPKLTREAAMLTWLKANPAVKDDDSKKTWTAAAIGEIFENIHLKIWKDGKTYYYQEIPHLGTDMMKPSAFGVVRNHIYDITINGIYGLGTPVFNPGQVIIPESVNPDEVYIAAQVNILSWRLVQKEVTLDWGK